MMKAAENIEPGDVILLLGGSHLVEAIESYVGANQTLGAFGIARAAGGWGMTLFTGQLVEIAEPRASRR